MESNLLFETLYQLCVKVETFIYLFKPSLENVKSVALSLSSTDVKPVFSRSLEMPKLYSLLLSSGRMTCRCDR